MTRFQRLALFSTAATLLLVAAGGLVRATGSGLGCLDSWPSCRGGWVAPGDLEGVIEYSHRALAAVAIAFAVAVAFAARRWGADRSTTRWAAAAVVPFFLQAWLGALVVKTDLHAALVTAHLVTAMFLVMASVRVAVGAFTADRARAQGDERRFAGMAFGAAAGTFLVLLVGTYVRETGAGLAFSDWPLMGGRVVPRIAGPQTALMFAHRALAGLVFLHVLATAIRARRDPRPSVHLFAGALLGAYVVQVILGALNVVGRLAPAAVLGHVAVGALTWAAAVSLVLVARSAQPQGTDPMPRPSGGVRDRIIAYVQLTKPRIVLLLLITTVPAMLLAQRGLPSGWLILATLAGGTLAAGGANAINQFVDRDIDEKMHRTRGRPLPSARVRPARALVFGSVLGVVAFGWLALTVNLLSALLAAGALLFYVFVYTVWLKRSTVQNIVVGGAAGAVPCLVGWAAVRGDLAWPAWIMFAIVFVWTPPHFWALAMRYKDDYAAAGVPMMPVVRGIAQTSVQILLYSIALVGVTVLLYPVARMGPIYLVAALALGAVFLYRAGRLWRAPGAEEAMGLFKYSITYLALLFVAIGADGLVAR